MSARVVKSPIKFRSFTIDRAKMVDDKESRTIELAFSSEAAVRSFDWDLGEYDEILDHKSSSVVMTRLSNRAPLLLEHDRGQQIGVIEKASIDADRIGRATVRFGKGNLANEIFQDVKDGIRSLVSVGYRVYDLEEEDDDKKEGPKTMRATRWEPMEISIVAIPADISVGVGRSKKDEDTNDLTIHESKRTMKIQLDKEPQDGGGGDDMTPEQMRAAWEKEAGERQKQREDELNSMVYLANEYGAKELLRTAMDKKMSLQDFQGELLKQVAKKGGGTQVRIDGLSRGQSIGEMFTDSESYKASLRMRAHRQVNMEIKDRATFLTTTGLTGYQRPPGVVLLEQQPVTIAMLCSQGETSQPTVRFIREVSYTQAATAVAEEGQKPEASFDLEEVDAAVKKIAVIGRVSDEMFADFAYVRDYVNNRLAYMVESKEDVDLLTGAGGNAITGILNTSNIQTQAAGTEPTIADALHKAITKVQAIGFFAADAIVMHPTDYQTCRLTKDANGQYFGGGPFGGAYGQGQYSNVGAMWGLPVVRTTAISQGTALVGAFRLGAQVWRKMGLTIDTTNSDASDFVYNRIAIRAEKRLALTVYRPLAFCTVTGIPA